jgi:hypothetical protein
MSSSSQFCTVMLLKPHRDYFGALGLLFWGVLPFHEGS